MANDDKEIHINICGVGLKVTDDKVEHWTINKTSEMTFFPGEKLIENEQGLRALCKYFYDIGVQDTKDQVKITLGID